MAQSAPELGNCRHGRGLLFGSAWRWRFLYRMDICATLTTVASATICGYESDLCRPCHPLALRRIGKSMLVAIAITPWQRAHRVWRYCPLVATLPGAAGVRVPAGSAISCWGKRYAAGIDVDLYLAPLQAGGLICGPRLLTRQPLLGYPSETVDARAAGHCTADIKILPTTGRRLL